jgi:HK97 family phage major capsid protein
MAHVLVDELGKQVASMRNELAELKKPARNASEVFGAPGYTSSLNSEQKPFSLGRFVKSWCAGRTKRGAEHEVDLLEQFTDALRETSSMPPGASQDALFLPTDLGGFGPAFMGSGKAEKAIAYVKAVMAHSQPVGDPDEARWLASRGAIVKAAGQSAFFDQYGGTLVAPPTQGEVIPLIRPTAAAMAAGASTMTLPPSGRHVEPRITSAPDVQALAEGSQYGNSTVGTDQMVLQAKKIGGSVVLSKESSLYTGGTMDQWVQSLLNGSLGLQLDAYAFYGVGGPTIPAGLTSYAGTGAGNVLDVASAYATAKGVEANGNKLLPQYGSKLPALIAERSFGQDGDQGKWVMRPLAYESVAATRASAVTSGDQEGPMVDILRRFAENSPTQWAGRQVVQSTNIRNNQTKGTGTGLTDVFYGFFKYMVIGSYGAVQFEQGMVNDQFTRDLATVKATMFADIGLRYPGSFLWYKQVQLAPATL